MFKTSQMQAALDIRNLFCKNALNQASNNYWLIFVISYSPGNFALHARDIMRQANNVEWVDEAYSKRLGGQLYNDVAGPEGKGFKVTTLKAARRSTRIYMGEEFFQYGPNGKHRGNRIFILDYSTTGPHIFLMPLLYDRFGRLMPRETMLTAELFCITRHAYERLFERMRTNSLDDVKAVIKQLIGLPAPTAVDEERDFRLEGLGVFHCVAVRSTCAAGIGPTWLIKTFIRLKPC
jgi:hypothetical protein